VVAKVVGHCGSPVCKRDQGYARTGVSTSEFVGPGKLKIRHIPAQRKGFPRYLTTALVVSC